MRSITIFYILSIILINTSFANTVTQSELKDSLTALTEVNNIVPETIHIGNVTELLFGYSQFKPQNIWDEFGGNYKNMQSNTLTLTQYFIVNNFLIQSGIELNLYKADYSVHNSWDSIYSETIQMIDTINTHYYIVDGDSIPEYIIDQYTIVKNDTIAQTVNYNGTNKISCLTIPLNLGYRWRFEKYALYFKIGTRFNFITSSKGKVFLTNSNEWVELNNLIKNKFHISGTANLAFEYPFSAIGSVIIEPEYRYSWYSRVSPGFTKNYHQFGVKLGIQFWF